jgi:hypothetical protein
MKPNIAMLTTVGALSLCAIPAFSQVSENTPLAAPAASAVAPVKSGAWAGGGLAATPVPPEAPLPPTPAIAYATDFSSDVLMNVDGGGFNRTLVIPKETTEAKDLGEIEEDLNVMARILDKAVSGREDGGRNAMGIVIHSGFHGPGAPPRNLYLEGYGAVFFLNVNYPLVEPGNKGKDEESKEDKNSEWEEARRELAQPGRGYALALPQPGQFMDGTTEEYDADKVEKLKTDLISALKNAVHIRRLKPEETVTVVVSGRGQGTESHVISRRGARGHATVSVYGQGRAESTGARLVLRVKKSDVEAFQKDKTSLEDFRKKVSMMVF